MSNVARFVICQKPYKCTICRESFETSISFVDHLLDKHFPDLKISLWDRCQISMEVRDLSDTSMY